jgi:hypothetical protein
MAPLEKVRRHFSRSLGETLAIVVTWVEKRSPIVRPAFYGAFFIWALILSRGALLVFPIALPVLFFADRALFWQLVLTFFFLAPAGGFLGGLLYGLVSPLCNHLGAFGSGIKYTFGAWGYLVVLVYAIMPVIEPEKTYSLRDPWDWGFIGGFGLVLGIAMAIGARRDAA